MLPHKPWQMFDSMRPKTSNEAVRADRSLCTHHNGLGGDGGAQRPQMLLSAFLDALRHGTLRHDGRTILLRVFLLNSTPGLQGCNAPGRRLPDALSCLLVKAVGRPQLYCQERVGQLLQMSGLCQVDNGFMAEGSLQVSTGQHGSRVLSCTIWQMRGLRVPISTSRMLNLKPRKASSREDLPSDCPPMATICTHNSLCKRAWN